MKSPAPHTEKRVGCAGRMRLLIFVLLVVSALAGYRYLRRPHLSGSVATSIDIVMRSPELLEGESKLLLQESIAHDQACSSLLWLLRSARRGSDHKCAAIGTFTIRYANDKVDTLAVLPGHNPARYEFRFGGGLYCVPREQLFQVLRDAGIDAALMPLSEH
jgi:hypothetical protein